MIAVVQRVAESSVAVDGDVVGSISSGLMVLLGVAKDDDEKDADYLAEKIANLRIFEDLKGKMNNSLIDISGEMLIISQFTLLGDCRKGRRPSFINAAGHELANSLYEYFIEKVSQKGIKTQKGVFGAMMDVSLVNSGPVTLIVESKQA